jgi:hypothetical protein
MKKEGTYKKDTAHRPLLKSTEKWDGRPETLAKQRHEARLRAKLQEAKDAKEARRELEKRRKDLARRPSHGSSGRETSLSLENLSSLVNTGNLFGFEVNSASTLDSRSSHSKSNKRPSPLQADSNTSDYSGTRKPRSENGSVAGDGDAQRGHTSILREDSTKSRSSSIPSEIAPFLDKDVPQPLDIPVEYRTEKFTKLPQAMPPISPHHPVLPTVIEPANEQSLDREPAGSHNPPGLSGPSSVTPCAPFLPRVLEPHEAFSVSYNGVDPITATFVDSDTGAKSSGAHIRSPPATVKREVMAVPFLAREAQELQLPDYDPSSPAMPKTACATPHRLSARARPLIPEQPDSSTFATERPPEQSRFKISLGTAKRGDIFPRKCGGDVEHDRHESERNITPTPAPGMRGIFKFSRLGLFSKDKNDR